MPVTPTYPGVYIEEIPSGVRTITGVATSITAFIGRARRGPVDDPITINNYGDFERIFGGMWSKSKLGYAVRDFYLNGGSQAIIVRLFKPDFKSEADRQKAETVARAVYLATDGADPNAAAAAARKKVDDDYKEEPEKTVADLVAKAAETAASNAGATVDDVKKAAEEAISEAAPITYSPVTVAGLTLKAAYPGAWGENLRATVDVHVSKDMADSMGLQKKELFNLEVRDVSPGGNTERFANLTFADQTRRIDRVLAAESKLVRWAGATPSGDLPKSIKEAHKSDKEEEKTIDDPVTVAEKALAKKKLEDPAADTAAEEQAVQDEKEKLTASDGDSLNKDNFIGPGKEGGKLGLYALRKADLFNLLCIPPYKADGDVDAALVAIAAAYCEKRRAMLLVDPPSSWNDKNAARSGVDTVGTRSKNAALFFPRLRQPDPLREDQKADFVPCGAVAGVFARTDTERGVWKAPAGLDAALKGVPELSVPLTDAENGELNPLGINCLRAMPAAGRIVWGSRTLQGDDRLASEWKYIPVRRLALNIEESLYRGMKWVVFEPNDEPLWAQIRLNAGAFMHNLFRQGAFQGGSPKQAYFVKCDKETTTQNDINLGIVNIVVGFAPLKPAEFVIIKLQQMAGQVAA